MKFIGYENDWLTETPKEVKGCKKKGHIPDTKSTEDCVHTTTCIECGIYWKCDSGD